MGLNALKGKYHGVFNILTIISLFLLTDKHFLGFEMQFLSLTVTFDSLQPSRASSPKMTATKDYSALPLQKYAIAG